MEKLISMTEFVIQEELKRKSNESQYYFEFHKTVFKYAQFLRRTLNLGMFVPCDEGRNVLKEPMHFKEWYSDYQNGIVHEYEGLIMMNYLKAKEKVLFKDFRFVDGKLRRDGSNQVWADIENRKISFRFPNLRVKTVEDLSHLFLELTKSAIKQIGL